MDIKLIKNNAGEFTIGLSNGDLIKDPGFDTAINISLFTNARAPDDKVLKPEDRRGWPGDLVSPVQDRIFGSWLWLVNQKRLIPENLNQSINFAQMSLNWLVIDGVAKSVIVSGEIIPRLGNKLTIIITSLSGETNTHYVELWENTGNVS